MTTENTNTNTVLNVNADKDNAANRPTADTTTPQVTPPAADKKGGKKGDKKGTDDKVAKEMEKIAKLREQLKAHTDKLTPEAREQLKKAEKAEKAASTRKESRISAAVKAIRSLNGKPKTVKELTTMADNIYVKANGKSNPKEALWSLRTTISTMEALGMIESKEDGIHKVSDTPAIAPQS